MGVIASRQPKNGWLGVRIVTWNCNGGFWRKYAYLAQLSADILVIQECNDPARSADLGYRNWAGENYAWVGQSANKGLGVFVRNNAPLTAVAFAQDTRFFLPVKLGEMLICGVWAHRDQAGSRHYCGQTHQFLSPPPAWLADPLCVFLGDMNSSRIWDRPNRAWNHSASVQILHDHGLVSAYHHSHQAEQGAEPHPSFFLHRNRAKPYHIDYVFHGRGWRIQHCEVGLPDDWLAYSDHMPVWVDLTVAEIQPPGSKA